MLIQFNFLSISELLLHCLLCFHSGQREPKWQQECLVSGNDIKLSSDLILSSEDMLTPIKPALQGQDRNRSSQGVFSSQLQGRYHILERFLFLSVHTKVEKNKADKTMHHNHDLGIFISLLKVQLFCFFISGGSTFLCACYGSQTTFSFGVNI